MTEVQDPTGQAAEPPACPQCGEADHVHRISAIPDMPAEYSPPRVPSSIDLAGAVVVALGIMCILVIPFTTGWMGMMGIYLIVWGAQRFRSKRRQKAQWQETMSRWERLYFCARDEVAFLPGETALIPISHVREFLYGD